MPSRYKPKRPANDLILDEYSSLILDDHNDLILDDHNGLNSGDPLGRNLPLDDRPKDPDKGSGPKLSRVKDTPSPPGKRAKNIPPEADHSEGLETATNSEALSQSPATLQGGPETLPQSFETLQGGPETLITAFFHSLFELSFDGKPALFSPTWEYLPAEGEDASDAPRATAFASNQRAKKPQRNKCQRNEPQRPDALPEDKLEKGERNEDNRNEDKNNKNSLPPAYEATTEKRVGFQARFPSGPIPRDQPGLIARRLETNLLAKLYYAAAMAEVFVFPFQIARQPEDKADQNRAIAHIVGLDRAVQVGLIEGYVICWPPGRYPKTARSIRLRVSGGRRERGRALGEIEAPLRAWIKAYLPH